MIGKSSETIPKGSRGEHKNLPEKVETLVYFYVLKDPRTNDIRYFGRTVDTANRLRGHIHEAKKNNRNRRERWIVSLLRRNLKPLMEIVYVLYCDLDEAIQTEKTFLKKLKKRFNLTNSCDRGLGGTVSTKQCYQYDKRTGVFIAEFQNVNQASIATGVKDVNIMRCCKNPNGYGSKSAGGYMWSFEKYEKLPHKYRKEPKLKPVECTDEFGNTRIFESAREAEKITGVSFKKISACCNNRQKSAGGYKWKFKC